MRNRIIRLKINTYTDREKIVQALANSGYKVWVHEKKRQILGDDFYVCFHLRRTRRKEDE